MADDKDITRPNELNSIIEENRAECNAPLTEECREMLIIARGDFGVSEYQGSRLHLEAEGVIPANFEWPPHKKGCSWQSGNLKFSLNRCRPPGLKGPMNLWKTADWWCLSWMPEDKHQNWGAKRINKKSEALAREKYMQSQQGIDEISLRFARYYAACTDDQFQSFKKLIPALQKKKPAKRRRAKDADVALTDIDRVHHQGVK